MDVSAVDCLLTARWVRHRTGSEQEERQDGRRLVQARPRRLLLSA